MQADPQPAATSKKMLWAGYVASALPVLMLVVSGGMKLMKSEAAVKGFADLGYNENVIIPLGIVELACTAIYLFPRTAVLGAILLTGYLGGATATHVRVGEPFYGPVIFGVLVWLGLYLRCKRIRALIPLRS